MRKGDIGGALDDIQWRDLLPGAAEPRCDAIPGMEWLGCMGLGGVVSPSHKGGGGIPLASSGLAVCAAVLWPGSALYASVLWSVSLTCQSERMGRGGHPCCIELLGCMRLSPVPSALVRLYCDQSGVLWSVPRYSAVL